MEKCQTKKANFFKKAFFSIRALLERITEIIGNIVFHLIFNSGGDLGLITIST